MKLALTGLGYFVLACITTAIAVVVIVLAEVAKGIDGE